MTEGASASGLPWLTPAQVADRLETHVKTVLRWIRAGKLKAYKIGNKIKITERQYADFLASCETTGPAPRPPTAEPVPRKKDASKPFVNRFF